jgi:uncharacterized protein
VLLALLLVPVTAALAQQQPQPATSRYLPEKPTYQIFVLGDGLAGGLAAGMARLAANNDWFNVDGRYKEDSGLARPEFYDWNEAIPKIFQSNEIDIVVMMVGMNDAQTIKDGDFRYAFGAPEWTTAYTARVDGLLATLKQTGAAIYWVSPPPMAAENYDRDIATIATLQKARVEAAGFRYIDIKPAFSDETGHYAERGPDDTGEIHRLRDRDGVHFMRVGNNKLASLILAAITKDAEGAAPPTAPTPAAAAPAANGQATAPASSPSFGQEATGGAGGLIQALPSPGPGATGNSPASAQAKAAANPQPISKSGFAKGTTAYDLFVTGVPPKPVQGRFDDFSYSEPQ